MTPNVIAEVVIVDCEQATPNERKRTNMRMSSLRRKEKEKESLRQVLKAEALVGSQLTIANETYANIGRLLNRAFFFFFLR